MRRHSHPAIVGMVSRADSASGEPRHVSNNVYLSFFPSHPPLPSHSPFVAKAMPIITLEFDAM